MSGPEDIPSAHDEQVDSLEAFYHYVKDDDGYEGSITQQWVESSAEYLNAEEIQDFLSSGDDYDYENE